VAPLVLAAAAAPTQVVRRRQDFRRLRGRTHALRLLEQRHMVPVGSRKCHETVGSQDEILSLGSAHSDVIPFHSRETHT
jgi:hypothetical protein